MKERQRVKQQARERDDGGRRMRTRNNGFFQPPALPLRPSSLPPLSFSPRLPQPLSIIGMQIFRPQGLKSGWRGANYYGKENKTQREGGKRDRESGENETRRGAALLAGEQLGHIPACIWGKVATHYELWHPSEDPVHAGCILHSPRGRPNKMRRPDFLLYHQLVLTAVTQHLTNIIRKQHLSLRNIQIKPQQLDRENEKVKFLYLGDDRILKRRNVPDVSLQNLQLVS
ncbi:unnamed protein product [Pleuronectes platessa]|uniref:Uncharacterized protein n=1 Tax=Pleuronectes platessa TaxID=8262 RepID=A0A9N7UBL9_PLEPL|nr:unnamed protein product [Pleuronectes platessa]